ncbi:Holliday junction branch migration protein RuvA [Prosthecobacter sp.]|uniref:Holliday junction branch migration protein RuvA n=1 Tax=Prosthecobacter sp. TaxID=1965333 RepID=UPI002AB95D9E|nr:Holliday junction branch migration protein RuvA [Prosthecobacter sp.]MDZ4403695.1 Holliday junction branch migration protein RuvA [Prosthecobacter sp.]
MIAFLRGILAEALPHRVTIDVHGVGYVALIPLTTFDKLPQAGAEVQLLTHYHVTDRDHTLFGFMTSDERDLFRLLMDRVSGIGPKMALSVLSGLPVAAFKDAVIAGDVKALSRIKGVGGKTAERIVLELKDKVGVVDAWQNARTAKGTHDPKQEAQSDAVLGLIALGYKQGEAVKTVNELAKQPSLDTADKLIREALRSMN